MCALQQPLPLAFRHTAQPIVCAVGHVGSPRCRTRPEDDIPPSGLEVPRGAPAGATLAALGLASGRRRRSIDLPVFAEVDLGRRTAESARQEAFEELVAHARDAGANGVLAMRYDANEIMPGVTEVLAYGTAVVIEPV